MKQETINAIEKLIREDAADDVGSVRIFINSQEITVNEYIFRKVSGRAMQNLRGEWIRKTPLEVK